MKINFILPKIGVSGGVKVVFEYANHLQERGHDVSIIYPWIPMLPSKWYRYNFRTLLKSIFQKIINSEGSIPIGWNLKANLVKVPTLAERYIPDADIIVATWWKTAYYVSKYNKSKGEKFYLIQGYEIWEGLNEKVNMSYKLDFKNIVISTWLKDIIINNVHAEIEALILNGINLNQFYSENVKRKDNSIRILMQYHTLKLKGIDDGIKAFEIVKEKHPTIKLVMFGLNTGKNVPVYSEFHRNPTVDELRRIYNSCDIFLFPSRNEGFGLPPMEAMACKIPVVTTNVGAVPDYTILGETALVSPPNDPESLAENIIRLIENERERKKIAENGYNYIKQFTWNKSTDELEKIFKKYVGEK